MATECHARLLLLQLFKTDTFNVEWHIRLETAWQCDFNGELCYLLNILLPVTATLHNTILPGLPNIKQSDTSNVGVNIDSYLFRDASSLRIVISFKITPDRNGDRMSCKIASIAIILKPDTFNVELHKSLKLLGDMTSME
jgi:hypothetical protein